MPKTYHFDDGEVAFDYTIIRKPKLKHIYLRVAKGDITLTAHKRVSESYLYDFLSSKTTWIAKQLQKSHKKPKLTDPDAVIYLLGVRYRVVIDHDSTCPNAQMQIIDQTALFTLHSEPTHKILQKLRDSYYQTQCHETITPIVELYANKMQLYPNKIAFRNNRSRWGSCSTQNNISLNTRLMMLPIASITYVVIHELAHIKHKNHSSDFWALVEIFSPNYRTLRNELRGFESAL
jgi:predicted metal-dependent hydrolase